MTDARIEAFGKLLSANEQLASDTIRHMLVLERFKKSEVWKITRFLEESVFPDIVARVDGGLGAIASRGLRAIESKRLADTLIAINATIGKGVRAAGQFALEDFKELAILESHWQAASLKEVLPLEGVSFNIPSAQMLKAAVFDAPVNGLTMKDWFKGMEENLYLSVKKQISIGLAQGETVPQMVRRLRGTKAAKFKDGVFATTKHRAEALVRTSTNHVSTRAREATYAENDDVIKEIQLVATLDSRTSDICMGYDGRTFPINEGPRPPFHFNCRTTTVPVTKSWSELAGLDIKEPPSKAQRASMTGEVPAKTTYGSWLKNQSKAIQDEAIGPARAALFRARKIGVKDLTNKFGRSLSLTELHAMIAAKAAKVGLPKPKVPKPVAPPPKPVAPPPVAPVAPVAPPLPPPLPPVAPGPLPPPFVADGWTSGLQTALIKHASAKTPQQKSYWKKKAQELGWNKRVPLPGRKGINDVLAKPFQLPGKPPVNLPKIEEALTGYINATSPSSKSYYKKKALAAGYDWKKPMSLDDVSAIIADLGSDGVVGATGLAPVVTPSLSAEIKDALTKYVNSTSRRQRSYYKQKALKLGWTGPLPKSLDDLETLVAGKPGNAFAPPSKLKVTPNQYDELVLEGEGALAGDFEEFSPRALAAIEEIQNATTLKEIDRIYADFIGMEGTIAYQPRGSHIKTLRDAAVWSIRHLDDAPGHTTRQAMVFRGGRAVLRDPLLGPAGGVLKETVQVPAIKWNLVKRAKGWYGSSTGDGTVWMSSRYWNKKNRDFTIRTQKADFDRAKASGQLPFKTTDGTNGQHTFVHELGHHFGMGRVYGGSRRLDGFERFEPLYKASQRYEDHTRYLLQSDWNLSTYARTDTREAWAETWARMVLQNPDEWDDMTHIAFRMVKEEYERVGRKLPAILRKAPAAPKGFIDTSKWKKIGSQKGSNPGGVYQAPDGKKYYVKFYDDVDQVNNEVVANRLYREAGLETTKVHHGYADGKFAVVSEWEEGVSKLDVDVFKVAGATDGFATDAWLANWDVYGLDADNLLQLGGKPLRVDAGGALLFRAQGAAKGSAFGDIVGEIESLRSSNSTALKLYGDLSDAQIATSISRVEAITDEAIDDLVDKYWRGGNTSLRNELKLKLKTRRNNLLEQRDKLLEKLAQEHKLAQVAEEARKLGLSDPRPYDVRYKEWTDSLLSGNPKEYEAIRDFTSGGFEDIRAYQRKGHAAFIEWEVADARKHNHSMFNTSTGKSLMHDADSAADRAQWEVLAREKAAVKAHETGLKAASLESALARGPAYQGTLWRGVTIMDNNDVKRQYGKVGGVIELPESNSFSNWRTKAWDGNVQIEIRNSRHSGVDVDILSANSGEMEILTRKDVRYRVVSFEEYGLDPDSWPTFETNWSDPAMQESDPAMQESDPAMQKAHGPYTHKPRFSIKDHGRDRKNYYIVLEEV